MSFGLFGVAIRYSTFVVMLFSVLSITGGTSDEFEDCWP